MCTGRSVLPFEILRRSSIPVKNDRVNILKRSRLGAFADDRVGDAICLWRRLPRGAASG